MLIVAGPANQRYLRIQISAAPRGVELIALIGHELQHALEVAASPDVRDEQSLITLYQRDWARRAGTAQVRHDRGAECRPAGANGADRIAGGGAQRTI